MQKTFTITGFKAGTRSTDPVNQNRSEVSGLIPVEAVEVFRDKDRGGSFPWANVRKTSAESAMGKDITAGLYEERGKFHDNNRGITIVARDAEFSDGVLRMKVEENGGLADGGTTTNSILAAVENGFTQSDEREERQYVKVTIKCGNYDEDEINQMVETLNRSKQVDDWSLANKRGDFDWLIAAMGSKLTEHVELFNGDDKGANAYRIEEIIQLLTLFASTGDELWDGREDFEEGWEPAIAYRSKRSCLNDYFLGETRGARYKMLTPVVKDIVSLYEHVAIKLPDLYNETGGKFGKFDFGKVNRSSVLPLTGVKPEFTPMAAIVYPLLAGLRPCLTLNGSVYEWNVDPWKVFDELGGKLFKSFVVNSYNNASRKLTQVGRDSSVYQLVASKVKSAIRNSPEKYRITKGVRVGTVR